MSENIDEQSQVRREKLVKQRELGRAYPHNVHTSHQVKEILEKYGSWDDSEKLKAEGEFTLAGRVGFLRSFGKAGFVKIKSASETFQFYVAKNLVSTEDFQDFKQLDLGDVVWAKGKLFRTKTGELSLEATEFRVLVKCLHTPPEKFHGLTDVEERYRKRYLDLISNNDSRNVFLKRFQIVQGVRDYFHRKGFLEVETPMMHPLVSGAAAKPFETHHNALDMPLFLRIAPELYLKRLVVGGFDRVFEMNRDFRNEGISVRHNPEFSMLEFYMAYATYHDLMDMTEELVAELAEKVCGSASIDYQGNAIDLGRPWKRISMEESIREMSGYQGELNDEDGIKAYLKSRGTELSGREGLGTLITLLFEEDVEKKLIQPTFVTGYPVEVSPLARRSEETSISGVSLTERFELFVNGQEIANGFNELNDPDDQRERFEKQAAEKSAGNEEACDFDEDYIRALEFGLPPTAGEGIGIDRLVMLLTNSASIRDVILFPQLKKELVNKELAPKDIEGEKPQSAES